MKIGFSALAFDQGKSGIAIYIQNLLASLSANDDFNQYQIFITKKDTALLPHLKSNFAIEQHNNFLSNPISSILWHNTIMTVAARHKDLDLIHIPTIRRIPLIKGCKIVATIHDFAPLVITKKYDRFRTFYHRHILSKCVHRCDHIIAISETTKSDLIKFTGYPQERISVIYSGINHLLFKQKPKEQAKSQLLEKYQIDSPYFVYVSRIEHPAKNHLNLIRAFEEFKRSYKNSYKLILVGADWPGAELVKSYATKSTFANDIRFLGFIPTEDVPLLYQGCDLMIFPSLYEGFGFPILESLASGAKVICSNIPAFQEIGKDFVEFFDPYNPHMIFLVMNNALSKKESSEETQNKAQLCFIF